MKVNIRILTIIIFFISVNIYSKNIVKPKENLQKKENKTTKLINNPRHNKIKKNDTTVLNLKTKLLIPVSKDKYDVTKIIMVKEKSKTDWLSYLLPIFTLVLGIFIQYQLEKKSNKKKIIKSGERWIAELQSLEEPIKKQIEVLNTFLEENKTNEFNTPKLTTFSYLNGDIFKSLDKNDLIKFIEIKNNKKKFKDVVKISNRTNGYVNILVHLHETLLKKINEYLSKSSNHTNSLSLGLQSFQNAFRDYGVNLRKELGYDPYKSNRYRPIADLYKKEIISHLQDGRFNPFVLEKDFFIPLVDILADLRLDPKTKELTYAVNSSLNAIKAIKFEKEYIAENINTIIEGYKNQLNDLEEVINNIKNTDKS